MGLTVTNINTLMTRHARELIYHSDFINHFNRARHTLSCTHITARASVSLYPNSVSKTKLRTHAIYYAINSTYGT